MAALHAGRMVEGGAPKLMGGDEQLGARFLGALAAGAESGWPGNDAAAKARRLRSELMAILGTPRANALLRCISRDGRLHPGLAPAVEGPIVNSEKEQYTPRDEAERLWADAATFAARGAARG